MLIFFSFFLLSVLPVRLTSENLSYIHLLYKGLGSLRDRGQLGVESCTFHAHLFTRERFIYIDSL